MRNSTRAAPIIALLLSLAGTTAAAQTTIGETGASFGDRIICFPMVVGASNFCGQTFTVPVGDNVLQSFTFLEISTVGALEFEIFQIAANTLVGSPLFSRAFGPLAVPQPFTFTPAGGLALTSGAQYAALVRLDASGESVNLYRARTSTYTEGNFVSCLPGPTCGTAFSDLDVRFQATFTGSTVPEPATVALLGVGLLGLGGIARRRAARA